MPARTSMRQRYTVRLCAAGMSSSRSWWPDGAELDVADGNGLTPIDFAMGRIPKGFNERNPEVRTETAALSENARCQGGASKFAGLAGCGRATHPCVAAD